MLPDRDIVLTVTFPLATLITAIMSGYVTLTVPFTTDKT